MAMKRGGLQSRQQRARGGQSGAWASSSQDFARLANLLFAESARYARSVGGNCSVYTLAGIPALFSALRCLLLELNSGMLSGALPRRAILEELAKSGSDVRVILKHYPVSGELQQNLELLLEVRHEIVHPAHQPWAFEVVSATVAVLIQEHQVNQSVMDGVTATYSEYLPIDAA